MPGGEYAVVLNWKDLPWSLYARVLLLQDF